MKTKITTLGLLLLAFFAFSCDDNDSNNSAPTAAEYNELLNSALDDRIQEFQATAGDGWINLVSAQGVNININGDCLTLNGNPVTGLVDIQFAELFKRGDMAVTNKPTMGIMPNGDRALLLSGGEFWLNVTKNGQQLDISCNMNLIVPAGLTGTVDNTMSLWTGTIDDGNELIWEENDGGAGGQGGVFAEGNNYYVSFGDFGWTNVDRFYNDPRPKTTILVDVPDGYDNENSSVFLTYDDIPNALAALDTFTDEGFFSEHYGQVPIGLVCGVIFVTEEDGNYRYAIKQETIEADEVITFTLSETSVGTEAELVAAINAVHN